MSDARGIDLDHVWAIQAAENERFLAEHPRSLALRDRARTSMPGGIPMTWFETNMTIHRCG
jgi:hypothetical protein